MFDITTQAVAPTAIINLKDAAGEPMFADTDRALPCQIEVWGPGSDAYGIVESRQTTRAVKRMQENDNKITAPPYDERIREEAEDLATLTRRFINFGYPPAGDAQGAELFAALYRDPALGFVKAQVSQRVKDWSVFKVASGAS